jgi:hypothetical protein
MDAARKTYHLPIVVRIRMTGGEIVKGCDVYIGRRNTMGGHNLKDSIWMNRFTVKTYGIDTALRLYEEDLRSRISEHPLEWYTYLIRLVSAGRPLLLGCWCKDKPTAPCHGDIIVKICSEVLARLRSHENNP